MNNSYYPRPQLKRNSFISLDGEWTLNGKTINVPYPPQSPLSGFEGEIPSALIYEKSFSYTGAAVTSSAQKCRLLLHFGAVDQICSVFINGSKAASHEGGYLPFTVDITSFIKSGNNTLRLEAIDALSKDYPYGKQTKKPGGMWYTQVSGIWQSVWMEEVPDVYIENVKITADPNGADIEIYSSDKKVTSQRIDIEDPAYWTCDDPVLYYRNITYMEDTVQIYFALRTIAIKENNVLLNGKPVFLHGVLDQGYFTDGLFIPGDFSEYEKDILRMKELGFNMLRKHIKIEPEQFYYDCDRLGMLVIQDMPNSGSYSFLRDTVLATLGIGFSDKTGTEGVRKQFFISHMKDTVLRLYNHPCIIAYTIFNEGWGQFESDKMYELLKEADPFRLIDSTSGWFAQKKSDFDSRHIYFRTKNLKPVDKPLLLSECGGFTLPVKGHLSTSRKYGYGACRSKEELTDRIISMYEKMVFEKGLCGVVYTQLSDIEDEINGLYTYDRSVCKVIPEKMKELAKRLKESSGL